MKLKIIRGINTDTYWIDFVGLSNRFDTALKIDNNVFNNLDKYLLLAKKQGIKYKNIGQIKTLCRSVLSYLNFEEQHSRLINSINKKKQQERDIETISYKKPKTYLMKDDNTGLYKIGFSNNPKKRESTLQSEKPTIKLVKVWNKDIEWILHKKYKTQRIRGEWFNLSNIQVKYICTHY